MNEPVVRTLDAIAHDLRNHANVVLGGAQLWADEGDPLAAETVVHARTFAVLTDRLIELARANIRANSETVMPIGTLLESARTRAHRDHRLELLVSGDSGSTLIAADLPRTERLIADAAASVGTRSITIRCEGPVITLAAAGPENEAVATETGTWKRIAHEVSLICGCDLAFSDVGARIEFAVAG